MGRVGTPGLENPSGGIFINFSVKANFPRVWGNFMSRGFPTFLENFEWEGPHGSALCGSLGSALWESLNYPTLPQRPFALGRGVNHEFEYVIPLDEAQFLFRMSPFLIIEKTRYVVEYKRKIWEVDEFHADNEGLTVAEIELDEENELFKKPSWLGEEVTADYRYLNSNLAKNPFSSW